MALSPRAFAYGVAAILLAAGVFQLSPLKQACLRACRSPLGFLLGHWRAGLRGSLALGWAHALFCLGCCWALMVVLVAAGAMGLAWVLLITAMVAAEKLLPGGEWIARATGGAFLLLGVAVALRPDLVTALRGGHAM
jgi:predicted metal-binding membrane protein